tara:strand:+ start:412 stop:633 length:222 start_codon:yes stop_codon:yes gene_type:complete
LCKNRRKSVITLVPFHFRAQEGATNAPLKGLTSSAQNINVRALVERVTLDSPMSVDTHFIPFFFFVLENDGST